jgi:tetratricopeptide (TPR) repeat protein
MTDAMKSAHEQYQAGNVQQAEALCREILKSQPDNADILHLLGLICYERGEYDAAERHIVRSLQANPSNTNAHCNLGNVWKSKGLPDKAISSYVNAIRLAPHAPEAFNNIGMVFLETGQPDEAIKYFTQALQLDSKIAYMHYNLGVAFQQSGRLNEAIACYKNTLELDSKFHEAFGSLVGSYKEMNMLDQPANSKFIHCIGDSHACFFSGRDEIHNVWPFHIGENLPFRSYRLGAPLAYNLCTPNTTTRGRENLFLILETLPEQSNVLLTFGETDCRAHLGKQADLQNRPVEDIVRECVDRYFGVVQEIRNRGFKVGVWGVIPSTEKDASRYTTDHPFPVYGTCKERNIITRLFNDYLEKLCLYNNIIFISLFKDFIHDDLTADLYYYMDPNHLAQKAFPLALSKILAKYGRVV